MEQETPEELKVFLEDINFDEMEQDIAKFAQEPSVRQVLEVGVDLKNYNTKISEELREAETESIDDYLKQVSNVKLLHQEIEECDKALESIEKMLDQFKGSLGQLSSDISSLQTQSQAITLRLSNRKALEESFGSFTHDIALSPSFIRTIENGPVGPTYIPALSELHRKLIFIQKPEVKSTKSYKEVSSPLDHLRMKASDNIRKWMVTKTNELRDSYGTEQVYIQNSMLQCAFLFQFLKENSRDVEQATKNYYVDVISRIYLDNFKQLVSRLLRQMNPISMSQETIVPQQQKSFFFFKTKTTTGDSTPFFSLGDRAKILTDPSAPPQQFKDDIYPVEALWRSMYQTLIDTVTAEHVFASQFFLDDNIASVIFAPTTKFLEQFMDDFLLKINEPVCVAILLRFLISLKNEMDRRKVFKIDQHLSEINRKLQERFRAIIHHNIESINTCDPHIFLENPNTAHHATSVTRRFAEFAYSMSVVINDSIKIVLEPQLFNVSTSVINLIERSSKLFVDPSIYNEMAAVFQINNYFLILQTLINPSSSIPVLNSPLASEYERLLSAAQELFIDTEIHIHFPSLFEAVSNAFSNLKSRENPKNTNITIDALKKIANDFQENHVKQMQSIALQQMQKFGDFGNGSDILENLAKRLALYWTKFEDLYVFVCKGSLPNNFLSVQQLVNNIKNIVDPSKSRYH